VRSQRTRSRGGGDTEGRNRAGASSARCRSTDLKSRRRRAVSGALSMELALPSLASRENFRAWALILVLRLPHETEREGESVLEQMIWWILFSLLYKESLFIGELEMFIFILFL
jgi:hypothetical protein